MLTFHRIDFKVISFTFLMPFSPPSLHSNGKKSQVELYIFKKVTVKKVEINLNKKNPMTK